MNTIFIGIAGGTGSGKTTLTEHLAARFGSDISVVHHDNYYKRQDRPFEERCQQNYDHPDAFDTDLMIADLKALKRGETIHCPVYDYAIHNRTAETVEVKPTKVVIVEGILIFQNKELRDLLDIKIFVETDADVRILRRALRDVEERGRSLESVVNQYLTTVKPMHEQFVEPTRKFADIIVLGCQVLEDGRPSLMLQKRIDAAYGYLSAHPDAACVASGGLDDSETVTEAQCIRSTLVSMGIDEGRIYLEDRSRSTEENLSFSAAIIQEQGLPQQAVIASDNFHQLRAAIWAERDGLTPYAAGCASPWFLTAGYWAREAAALLCMAVTGM